MEAGFALASAAINFAEDAGLLLPGKSFVTGSI